jgi:cysteinyl-tRNA synthetase
VAGAAKQAADVRAMMAVLGLDPLAEHWSGSGCGEGLRPVVGALVDVALRQREAARDRKDYAAADAIRNALREAGIDVEDTPRGPRWELRR